MRRRVPGDRRWRRLGPVLVVLAVACAYLNALSGPFVFDDLGAIVENPHVRRLWPLAEALTAPPQATVAGRPIVSLSLALNHAVGGLDVRGYHLTNVAIHVLCALAVLGVVRRTLRSANVPSAIRRHRRGIATACAVLWAVHPLCTETVNYVVQRTESIMSLFYLLTLYCSIRAFDDRRRGTWTVAAVAACAAGMASKEAMVTAPVAVALHDLAYGEGGLREIARRRWPLHAGLAATWGVLLAIMSTGPRSETVGFHVGISAADYAANQAVLVLDYLRTAIWPHPLVFDYGYARPLVDGAPVMRIVAVLALVGLAAFWFLRQPARGYPALWIFLVLAPTSTIVPIVSEVGAERRMYLPLVGLVALGVAAGCAALSARDRQAPSAWSRRSRYGAIALVTACAAAWAWTTRVRNEDYRDPERLWRTAVAARPENPRAHNNLGRAIQVGGRPAEAIADYERALGLDPDYSQAHFNLGTAYAELGRTDEAIAQYRRALALNPGLARAHHNLGAELANRGRVTEAIGSFRDAVRHAPEWAAARHKLGRALLLVGQPSAAREQLEEAIRLDPDHAEALSDLAWILATDPDPRLRDGERAVRCAERAAELTRHESATVLDTLAAAYAESGRFRDAVRAAERARSLAARSNAVALAAEVAGRVELYRTGRPYRERRAPGTDTAP